jgi:hypothetical protein
VGTWKKPFQCKVYLTLTPLSTGNQSVDQKASCCYGTSRCIVVITDAHIGLLSRGILCRVHKFRIYFRRNLLPLRLSPIIPLEQNSCQIWSFPSSADKHLIVLGHETVKILHMVPSKISSSIYWTIRRHTQEDSNIKPKLTLRSPSAPLIYCSLTFFSY